LVGLHFGRLCAGISRDRNTRRLRRPEKLYEHINSVPPVRFHTPIFTEKFLAAPLRLANDAAAGVH
jgi:hypothetical protein